MTTDPIAEAIRELRAQYPALPVARCGQISVHAPHLSDGGPDRRRICPGSDGTDPWAESATAAPQLDHSATLADWLEYRQLPPDASLADLIEAERGAAKLAAGFELLHGQQPTTAPQPATPAQALRWGADRWRREAIGINEWPTEAMLRRWADELDAAPATPSELDLDASELAEAAREWDALQQTLADATARVRELEADVQRRTAERDMLARAVVHPQRAVDATMLDTAPAADPGVYRLPDEPPAGVLWDRKGDRWDRDDNDPHHGYHFWRRERDDWVEHYPTVLARLYPLSTTPPAGTEGER